MPMPANPTSRIAIADVDKRLVSGLSTHPGQTSRFRGRTVRDHRILILHDGPPPVALHYYEGPDVPLVFVLNAVGCCESCHPAGNRHHSRICICEPDVHVLDVVGNSLQKSRVYFLQLARRRFSPESASAVWVDVVPIFCRKTLGLLERVCLERGLERLHGLPHRVLVTTVTLSHDHDLDQKNCNHA